MAEPLGFAGPRILQCRGAGYECDVFSVLKENEHAMRSCEFGLADGAVDCTKKYRKNDSFAERFWDVYERRYTDPSTLLLFEVKSSVGSDAGEQTYVTSIAQRRHVAFYIGIIASDPTFVDLIPNYQQNLAALTNEGLAYITDKPGQQEISVNAGRRCCLPPRAYGGIDQSMAPYRLPLWMLPKAIGLIRECALNNDLFFVNPWTGVEFRDWRPQTTTQVRFLSPFEDADQASAFEALMDLYRTVKQDDRTPLDMDLMALQPSLADFKFLHDGRQSFVQHKLSTQLRSMNAPLDKIGVARGEGNQRQYFFSAFDR